MSGLSVWECYSDLGWVGACVACDLGFGLVTADAVVVVVVATTNRCRVASRGNGATNLNLFFQLFMLCYEIGCVYTEYIE